MPKSSSDLVPRRALRDDGVIEGCGMAAAFAAATTHPSQSIYSQSRQGASINDVRTFEVPPYMQSYPTYIAKFLTSFCLEGTPC